MTHCVSENRRGGLLCPALPPVKRGAQDRVEEPGHATKGECNLATAVLFCARAHAQSGRPAPSGFVSVSGASIVF